MWFKIDIAWGCFQQKCGSRADHYFQDKMSMTSSQNESDSGYRYTVEEFDLVHLRSVDIFVFSPIFSLTVCAVLLVGLHIRKREI